MVPVPDSGKNQEILEGIQRLEKLMHITFSQINSNHSQKRDLQQ